MLLMRVHIFVSANITPILAIIRPSHAALIGVHMRLAIIDDFDLAVLQRNGVNRRTPCRQRVRLRWATVVLQLHRISEQRAQTVRRQKLIGAMLRSCGWIEGSAGVALEDVIAVGCERSLDVWFWVGWVGGHDAVILMSPLCAVLPQIVLKARPTCRMSVTFASTMLYLKMPPPLLFEIVLLFNMSLLWLL